MTSGWQLWAYASQVLVFLVTQCSLSVWHSAELEGRRELDTNKTHNLLSLSYLIYRELTGNNISVFTHSVRTVFVICLPAFHGYFPWLTPIWFSLLACDSNVWLLESEESARLRFCTQQPLCHLPEFSYAWIPYSTLQPACMEGFKTANSAALKKSKQSNKKTTTHNTMNGRVWGGMLNQIGFY